MKFGKVFSLVPVVLISLSVLAVSPSAYANTQSNNQQSLITTKSNSAIGSTSNPGLLSSTLVTGFWSTTAPINGHAANAKPLSKASSLGTTASPMYTNDLGCAGVPEGSQGAPPYYCRASAYNSGENAVIMVRVGSYGSSVYPDFGWTKFFYKHNLYLQPVLDVITYGTIDPNDPYAIMMYHYTNGNVDMEVRVVYNATNNVSGYIMPDGNPVGVQTAYCVGYTDCPAWVNQTL